MRSLPQAATSVRTATNAARGVLALTWRLTPAHFLKFHRHKSWRR
jgi:hypothetical protein